LIEKHAAKNSKKDLMKTPAKIIMTICLAAALVTVAEPTGIPDESVVHREARMAWWREAKFGMFIHWGVYSVPAGFYHDQPISGLGEWIMHNGKIPMDEYQQFAKEFNPVKFNADEWVAIAKNAGIKYIVITSKHHDGFAMFDSKASDWNIVKATPYAHDPLKDLAEACRQQRIKLGFYYSQAQDWNNGGSAEGGKWDPAQQHSMDDYIDKIAASQVREILSNYGEFPAVLWWDTSIDMNPERVAKILAVVKELKPNIIMNNRLGPGFRGDTETPEQNIPAQGYKNRDWETCMTINDTWGYKRDDNNWKTTETLIRNLCDIVSKGGNYLLNVGPTSEGVIPAPEIERLNEVGAWMKVNSEAIYGSSASPFPKQLKWGRCTQKDGKLYIEVFDWPADGKLRVPLLNKGKAWLLASPHKKLKCTVESGGLAIQVPANAPDKIASVIVFQPKGKLQLQLEKALSQREDGSIFLPASSAEIVGSTAQLEGSGEQNIGYWTDAKDSVRWQVEVQKPGDFDVTIHYAVDPGSADSDFSIAVGNQAVNGKVSATRGWGDYHDLKLGTLRINRAGKTVVTVKSVNKVGLGVMNLRSIMLTPVGK